MLKLREVLSMLELCHNPLPLDFKARQGRSSTPGACDQLSLAYFPLYFTFSDIFHHFFT